MDTAAWLRLQRGAWSLAGEGLRRLTGTFACIVGLAYVAMGALCLARLQYAVVYDNPESDTELRRELFVVAAITVLAGASSLHSGVVLFQRRKVIVNPA